MQCISFFHSKPLFLVQFHGNCVGIDHGHGVFSVMMHLEKIDVQLNERVFAGDRSG